MGTTTLTRGTRPIVAGLVEPADPSRPARVSRRRRLLGAPAIALHRAALADEHVAGLHVTVHDPGVVDGTQRPEQRLADLCGALRRQRPGARALGEPPDRGAEQRQRRARDSAPAGFCARMSSVDERHDRAAATASHWAAGIDWAELVQETRAEEGDLVRMLSRTGESLLQIAGLRHAQ